MRLICPNCGAQYEVPTEVIPETGRDVQCSDCGTTWFQHHPDHPAAEDHLEAIPEPSETGAPETLESEAVPSHEEVDYTAEAEAVAEEVIAPEPSAPTEDDVATEDKQSLGEAEPEPSGEAAQMQPEETLPPQEQEARSEEPDTASEPDTETTETTDDWPPAHEPEPEPDLEANAETEAPEATPEEPEEPEDEATASEPEKKRLDDDIAAVLRQEAERETRAREEERRSGLETQPDLGLTQHDSTAQQRTREAEARMSRLRGDDFAADKPTTVVAGDEISDDLGIDPASRSNLLPDIDEINSSLETQRGGDTPAHDAPADMPPPRGGGGFRTGFRLAVLLALFGLLVYVFAGQLAGAVPALEGALTGYVAAIDGIRAQLSGLAESLASSVEEPNATE